jgi:hypothetical protein
MKKCQSHAPQLWIKKSKENEFGRESKLTSTVKHKKAKITTSKMPAP